MPTSFNRRSFLGRTAVLGSALACTAVVRGAGGEDTPRIEGPMIDELKIEVLVDGAHDIFISGAQVPGVKIERTRLFGGPSVRRTLLCQWGLALYLQSRIGKEWRRYLLDFGYTSDVLANNIELLGVDIGAVDALILSHGHQDHFGGLAGFLAKYRAAMREDLRLYIGGEDVFCHRYRPLPVEASPMVACLTGARSPMRMSASWPRNCRSSLPAMLSRPVSSRASAANECCRIPLWASALKTASAVTCSVS